MKIGISACLLGDNVRYDGKNQFNENITQLISNHEVIKICPELLAGFSTPRIPMEIIDNRVINKEGLDLSEQLSKGCQKAYEKINDCDFLILKSKSPSCGYKQIYSGKFDGSLSQGNGYFASLCIKNNIKIFTENDYEEIKRCL